MKQTIYEIYVDDVFQEAWENWFDAVARAMNIEDELFDGQIGRIDVRKIFVDGESV